MPVMNRMETVQAIPAGETGLSDIPVIALTADAMVGVEAELLGHGFDAVEAKPIASASLFATLARLLEAARPTDAPRSYIDAA